MVWKSDQNCSALISNYDATQRWSEHVGGGKVLQQWCVQLEYLWPLMNILDGKVHLRGVAGPTHQSIYEPVCSRLEEVGLGMKEMMLTIWSGPADTTKMAFIGGEGSRKLEYPLDEDLAMSHARMKIT